MLGEGRRVRREGEGGGGEEYGREEQVGVGWGKSE
jgi:hypothetical protein